MGYKSCCCCSNNNKKDKEISFFKVPKRGESINVEEYIAFIGEYQWSDTVTLFICEEHFSNSNIFVELRRKRLVSNAVPNLRNPHFSDDSIEFLDKFLEFNKEPCGNVKTKIVNFNELVIFINGKKSIYPSLDIKIRDDGILVVLNNKNPPFDSLFQVFIDKSKKVSIFNGPNTVNMLSVKEIFLKPYQISSFIEVDNILTAIMENFSNYYLEFEKAKFFSTLKADSKNEELVDFFEIQYKLANIPEQARRYDIGLIIWSYTQFTKSRTSYEELLKNFYLPSIRTLRRYTQGINSSLTSEEGNYYYFHNRAKN